MMGNGGTRVAATKRRVSHRPLQAKPRTVGAGKRGNGRRRASASRQQGAQARMCGVRHKRRRAVGNASAHADNSATKPVSACV